MEKILSLEKITKKYDGTTVLNEVTADFYAGEAIAFVGHNGCGKSTLIRILSGVTAPSSGKVSYEKKLTFAFVPDKFPPANFTAKEYLKHIADIEGVSYTKIQALAEDFFLTDMLNTKMKNLSKGSLQKVGVIQALLGKKDVILLDEPLSGQDVDSQKVFVEKINELVDGGTTVFMACHEPELVEAIATKVFTIEAGNLIAEKEEGK